MLIQDFDKIYCINLPGRKDRRLLCEELFLKFNINVEFIDAIDGKTINHETGKITKEEAGCCLSHKKVLQLIISNNSIKKALILEDDVEFHSDIEHLFQAWYPQVPSVWELLYFGGSHRHNPKKRVHDNVHKLKKTYTTHCYAITRECALKFIEEIDSINIFLKPIDVHLASYQSRHFCYGFMPHLAWQRADYSDIRKNFVDYKIR